MENDSFNTENFFKTACYFEGALVLLAVILGWATDIDPFSELRFSEADFVRGIVATIPLLLIFFAIQQISYPPLQQIRQLLLETLASRLHQKHWTDLLILASIAGISEEILFRGFLQPWLEQHWEQTTALVASNLVFALVHAITPLYALLALLMGLYLGVSLDYPGERTLLIPIVIHSLYDFVAFLAIMRQYHNSLAD